MPRLSKQERADLEARLAADDADDDDDEIEYTHSDGRRLRGRYSRVSQFAESLGTRLKPEPPADPGDGDTGTAKRFTSGRRTG